MHACREPQNRASTHSEHQRSLRLNSCSLCETVQFGSMRVWEQIIVLLLLLSASCQGDNSSRLPVMSRSGNTREPHRPSDAHQGRRAQVMLPADSSRSMMHQHCSHKLPAWTESDSTLGRNVSAVFGAFVLVNEKDGTPRQLDLDQIGAILGSVKATGLLDPAHASQAELHVVVSCGVWGQGGRGARLHEGVPSCRLQSPRPAQCVGPHLQWERLRVPRYAFPVAARLRVP